MNQGYIEIERWVPNPERPGYLKYAGNRTKREVFTELKDRLEQDGLSPDEYFLISGDLSIVDNGKEPFPEGYRWIACYPVTGRSEGHYIHVDVMVSHERHRDPFSLPETYEERNLVFLGKTFKGFDFAARVAAACAKHLGA